MQAVRFQAISPGATRPALVLVNQLLRDDRVELFGAEPVTPSTPSSIKHYTASAPIKPLLKSIQKNYYCAQVKIKKKYLYLYLH